MAGRQGISGRLTRHGALGFLLALVVAAPAEAQLGQWMRDGRDAMNLRYNGEGPAANRAATLVKVWEQSFSGDVTGTPILAVPAGQPEPVQGYVYVGSYNGHVYAMDQKTGTVRWTRFVGGQVAASALFIKDKFGNETLFVVTAKPGSPALVAMDPLTGAIKWTTTVDFQPNIDAWASPAFSGKHNLVYVGTCTCKADEDATNVSRRGSVVAVDATSGAVIWKTYTVPPGRGGGHVKGTPLVYDDIDRVFVGTGHSQHPNPGPLTDSIVALKTDTGEVLGKFQIRNDDSANNSHTSDPRMKTGFHAGPNALNVGSKILIGDGSGYGSYYAIDPVTMAKVWEAKVGVASSRSGVHAASAYDGKRIYIASSLPGTFWGIKPTGALTWATPDPSPLLFGDVSTSKNVVWATDSAGFLTAFNGSNGAVNGRTPLGKPSLGGVAFARGYAYVSIGTGKNTGGGVVVFR